eukprot:TRINITY_DN2615_c0_g1_i1.p1 TRINITY_DN2615_c0_g1~~TRINITY_DN2615_c0_g1_i1.p1  ORF type:complete len:335 (-),score=72.93 TRINITY_DN2615_c0_g1_i1:697-1701(-)
MIPDLNFVNAFLSIFVISVSLLAFRIWRFVHADADLQTLNARIPSDHFKGKVVWVVGASSGIGEYLAYKFVKEKAHVILSARRLDQLERVRKSCEEIIGKNDNKVEVMPLDILDYAAQKRVTESILKKWGSLDVVALNSGISQRSLVEEAEFEVDKQLFEINVMSYISLTKLLLPSMLKARKGHFMVTSSVAGKLGTPVSATYASTKHALHGFFDSLRYEVVDSNIKVTLFCPGPVVSEGSQNAFSAKSGQTVSHGKSAEFAKATNDAKMSSERCAELAVSAVANQIDESWISTQPILTFVYLVQYAPSVAKFISKKVVAKRVTAYKSGSPVIN